MKTKKNLWFAVPPVLLAVWPYTVFLAALVPEGRVTDALFLWYVVLTAAVYVLNIVHACRACKRELPQRLAFWDMVLKLVHVPFYLMVFCVGVLLLFAMVVPALLFLSPLAILTLAAVDYLLLVTSSSYGIAASFGAKRRGTLPTGRSVLHIVLHFLFVADLISAVCLYVRLRKAPC